MKKLTAVFAGGALFLSACDTQQDAGAPPEYVATGAPDWVRGIRVENVNLFGAHMRDSFGQRVSVARAGTDIGRGLTASRDADSISVVDSNGIECDWDSRERLSWCKRANPAYAAYLNARNNMRF